MVSYLIECNAQTEAMNTLEKCEKIAEFFELKPLQAKLVLLKMSLSIKTKQMESIPEMEEMIVKLQDANRLFNENQVSGRFKDAVAESFYLQAIILIQICHRQIDKYFEASHSTQQ